MQSIVEAHFVRDEEIFKELVVLNLEGKIIDFISQRKVFTVLRDIRTEKEFNEGFELLLIYIAKLHK